MNVGEVLLAAAAVSALAASAGGVLSLVHGDRRWEQISRYGALLSLALLTAVLSILAYLFLASDLSTEYVWSHSSVSIDPFYKLVGMWAGGEVGSCCGRGLCPRLGRETSWSGDGGSVIGSLQHSELPLGAWYSSSP